MLGYNLFREANNLPRVQFKENCEEKYVRICSPQMEAIVFIILGIFFATCIVLKIWEYSPTFPSFYWGILRSRDVFRPIERERKYLMDYNIKYATYMIVNTTVWKNNLLSADISGMFSDAEAPSPGFFSSPSLPEGGASLEEKRQPLHTNIDDISINFVSQGHSLSTHQPVGES